MSPTEWPPWKKRISQKAEADRIEREGQRNQAIVASIDSLAHEIETSRQEQGAQESRKATRERWTIRWLFGAAACALLGFLVSMCQASLTREAIDDAKNSAQKQSIATSKSLALTEQAANAGTIAAKANQRVADAANQQLQIMNSELEEMKAAQRPLVFPKIGGPLKADANSGDWVYTMTLKNTGNSPTVGLEAVIMTPSDDSFRMMSEAKMTGRYGDVLQVLQEVGKRINAPEDPKALLDRPDFRKEAHINMYKLPIGPRDEVPVGSAMIIQLHIDQMASGDNSPFYYGAIRYFDFPDRKTSHVTEFCYDLVNALYIGKEGKVPIAAPCKYWNCNDQECDRDKKQYEADVKALPPMGRPH